MDNQGSSFRKIRTWPRKLRRNLRQRGLAGTVRLAWNKVRLALTRASAANDVDRDFDRKYNVDTAGIIDLGELDIDSPQLEYGNRYQGIAQVYFREIMSKLEIGHEAFTFVDLGSGKGRALLLAALLFPFKRIIGVELSRELNDIAARNLRSFRCESLRCGRVETIAADAATYVFPHDQLVIYMNNPFEEKVMDVVLGNIRRSLAEHPRQVFVVYVNAFLDRNVERGGFRRLFDGMVESTSYAVYTGF